MKYLLWDEGRAGMVACSRVAGLADATRDTRRMARGLTEVMENTR